VADQGGGGVLVAVAGGRGHGQPQPVAGRYRPARLGRQKGWPEAVAVLVGWGLDRQMALKAAQGLLAGLGRLDPGPSAPGKTSVGRQARARATMAWARAR
jgi:hypothetical protein